MKIKEVAFLGLIIISSIAIAITAIYNKDGVYKDYYQNIQKTPSEAVVFKAASRGVYPWSKVEIKENKPKASVDKKKQNQKTDETLKPKEFKVVDDTYFDDALFIGDSRMVGLSQYCEPIDTRATFFAKKSLTIYDIRDEAWIETEDGRNLTLTEALSERQYKKIYIMVGINEIGIGDAEYFKAAFDEVLGQIFAAQPDAYVFINSIMHVSKEKNDTDELYNNANINERNAALMTLADNIRIFYVDINAAIDDGMGNLNPVTTSDGVHLKGAFYEPWHIVLLQHGVE